MSRKNASTSGAIAARAAPPPPPLTEDASAIIAVAAHELKNALGGIGVALARCEQRLAGGHAVTSDDLAMARGEVRRLSALVNGLLDGARVDLGIVDVEPRAFDLAALAREVVQMFCAARGRPVTLDVPGGPVEITADAERVRAVLVNYLENAAKYAPPSAAVTVGVGPSPTDSGCVRLSVRDEGPGIARADQARLFQRFFRGSAADKRVHGLGLGLYLCQAVAEAHGGAVGVVSEPGSGATFWLDLPAGFAR
jgi:signal transduction histidine kinase